MKGSQDKPGAHPADAPPNAERDLAHVIHQLDVRSLSDAHLTDIMHHVATALKVRSMVAGAAAGGSVGVCYTRAADSNDATLWNNGFIVGHTTVQQAQAQGIPACG